MKIYVQKTRRLTMMLKKSSVTEFHAILCCCGIETQCSGMQHQQTLYSQSGNYGFPIILQDITNALAIDSEFTLHYKNRPSNGAQQHDYRKIYSYATILLRLLLYVGYLHNTLFHKPRWPLQVRFVCWHSRCLLYQKFVLLQYSVFWTLIPS